MHHDASNPVIVTPNVVDGPQNQHRELETAVVVESQAGRGGAKSSTDSPSVADEGRSDSSGLSDADGGDRCVENPISFFGNPFLWRRFQNIEDLAHSQEIHRPLQSTPVHSLCRLRPPSVCRGPASSAGTHCCAAAMQCKLLSPYTAWTSQASWAKRMTGLGLAPLTYTAPAMMSAFAAAQGARQRPCLRRRSSSSSGAVSSSSSSSAILPEQRPAAC